MHSSPFKLDADEGDPWSWGELRDAIREGRSVVLRGYMLGNTEKDRKNLGRFAGATFEGRVRFERCTFTVQLDLAEATFEQTLHLLECTFEKGLRLRDTTVGGRCSLRGSTIHDTERVWLNWRGLTTGGALRLMGLTAHAPIDLYQARIGGDLRLDGVHILEKGPSAWRVRRNTRLDAVEKHHAAGEMVGKALSLWGATIDRNLIAWRYDPIADADGKTDTADPHAGGVRVLGQVDLRCSIGGLVSFSNATIDAGFAGKAVDMDAATIGESVLFANRTAITGAISLRARVDGQVNFNNVSVNAGIGRTAINLESAAIGGLVCFRNRTAIIGAINLRAYVGGQVSFDDATVDAGTSARAVDMSTASIGGSVIFANRTTITGAIDVAASVGRQINFNNATVNAGTSGTAVNMAEANVGETVFFHNHTVITGGIDLRASIGGQVSFKDTTVDAGGDWKAIYMYEAAVEEAVFLLGGTVVHGGVVLLHADLRGGLFTTLKPRHNTFERPEGLGRGQRMPRACLITGDVRLEHAESSQSVLLHGLSVLGEVQARHLRVYGDLRLCGGVVGMASDTHRADAGRWIAASIQHDRIRARVYQRVRDGKTGPMPLKEQMRRLERRWNNLLRRLDPRTDDLGWQRWDVAADPRDASATTIDLELAHVKGHLWMRGQRVRGSVNASLARVEGDLSLDRSRIDSDLALCDATITGELSAEPTVEGEPAPLVHGTIDASGGTFESVTIDLGQAAKTSGAITCWYLFDGATVGVFRVLGRLEREGRKLFSVHRLGFKDLDFEGLSASGFDGWTPRDEGRVGVAIVLAWLSFLAIAIGGWPAGSAVVLWFLAAYVIVAGVGLRRSKAARRRQPDRPVLTFLDRARFSAAFYIDAERWARAAGDDPRADEIFLARRRRELDERRPRSDEHGEPAEIGERPTFDRFTRWWRWGVLDFVFGYGVRPARVIHLFVLLWLLNWAVFLPAAAVERPLSFEVGAHEAGEVPKPANPAWDGEGGTPGESDAWGPQKALFMAMRVQVPPVELFLDAEWKPADRVMFDRSQDGGFPWLTYENYAAVMRILNLILVPVIIAGATGLLKPREAQYTGAS